MGLPACQKWAEFQSTRQLPMPGSQLRGALSMSSDLPQISLSDGYLHSAYKNKMFNPLASN